MNDLTPYSKAPNREPTSTIILFEKSIPFRKPVNMKEILCFDAECDMKSLRQE